MQAHSIRVALNLLSQRTFLLKFTYRKFNYHGVSPPVTFLGSKEIKSEIKVIGKIFGGSFFFLFARQDFWMSLPPPLLKTMLRACVARLIL